MSLYEIYQPSFPNFNIPMPCFMNDDNNIFAPPFSSTEEYVETLFTDELLDFPTNCFLEDFGAFDDIPRLLDETKGSPTEESHSYFTTTTCEKSMHIDEFDGLFNSDMMESFDEVHDTEETEWNVCETHVDISPSLVLPYEGMVMDNHLSLSHLFMAYIEAMLNQETCTALAVSRRIAQKVDHIGGSSFERVLYYMFLHLNKKSGYVTQECMKNFYSAFKAVYQIFPYGKLIHLLANSAILQGLPSTADIIHLIDFDIGEGIQWGSLMETIARHGKEVRLTSVKLNEKDENSIWKFDETKQRLLDQAWLCGLTLTVEEVGLQDLESGLKSKGTPGKNSWYVFNCNVGLLHMGRARSKKDVLDFLRVANKHLQHNEGMITYGDGNTRHDVTSSCTYATYLDRNVEHYQALLESLEFSFPSHLKEARSTLECLFVAPYVSSIEWDRKWEELTQYGDVRCEVGLKGWELSEASLLEAKEMVKGRSSLYGVRMNSGKSNEVVVEWNGVPMVRLSCWTS